jgi:glycerol-3-phosphate acyltransferase PlsY
MMNNDTVSFVAAALLGYLLGSFPTAYLLVKWKSNRDIRREGSGNVGTLNSYEVTGSKAIGATVLLADMLKGMLAVFVVQSFIGHDLALRGTGAIGAVAGHNFSPWIGFKGGRGLATAAGATLLIAWLAVALWILVWVGAKKLLQDVNVANAVATCALLLTGLVVPSLFLSGAGDASAVPTFRFFVAALALLIIIRLIEPVRQYFNRKT